MYATQLLTLSIVNSLLEHLILSEMTRSMCDSAKGATIQLLAGGLIRQITYLTSYLQTFIFFKHVLKQNIYFTFKLDLAFIWRLRSHAIQNFMKGH